MNLEPKTPRWSKWLPGALFAAGTAVLACMLVIIYVQKAYSARIMAESALPKSEAIIILGASLKSDGTPSDALTDRLVTGVKLYKDGKASHILVTGDDGKFHTNEVAVMRQYLVDRGVSSTDILVDGQGYRTYESCSRAADIYKIRQAIIVTQNFHLPRALYLCNVMGMDAVGSSADLHVYKDQWWNVLRDFLASAKAWWDVNTWTPKPPV